MLRELIVGLHLAVVLSAVVLPTQTPAADRAWSSHPPMRPLPTPSERPLPESTVYFVTPSPSGSDYNDGSRSRPWKTLAHAVTRLTPGDTLCLRGGTYYESVVVSVSGTADKPITLRAYPGESAIVDTGIREFQEVPAAAWEPVDGGVAGEFRSTKSYAFGGDCGNFADSMVPLMRYLVLTDLRSSDEFRPSAVKNKTDAQMDIYCGPGVYRDEKTDRIHVRLAHTTLPGLGDHAYRGETDPRKLSLIIAGGDHVLRIEAARHLRIQDLVFRGSRRASIAVTDSGDIELDGLTVYAGGEALATKQVRNLRVVNCAMRGYAAPWHSRDHHKYRSHAGYLVDLGGGEFEIAHCELTDHHDGVVMHEAEEVHLHHNLFENFNDDGLEFGPKKSRGKFYIHQNRIARCLNPFTLHGKDPKPVESEPGHGVFIYRNMLDFRKGVYRTTPETPDSSGAFLNEPPIRLAHEHGGAVHPNYYVYHNTFLLPDGLYQNLYLYGWGSATRHTTRRVFNNIFVQLGAMAEQRPTPVRITPEDDFQEDGNLIWSVRDGRRTQDSYARLRSSQFIAATQQRYPGGWGAHDLFVDPLFVRFDGDLQSPSDVRLQASSPAVDAGVEIPAEWPDPIRQFDRGRSDIGALPAGSEPLVLGIRGRLAAVKGMER